jgi:hypothetical protein
VCAVGAGGAGAAAAAPGDVFTIAGDLGSTTLYPGGSGSLDLSLTNPGATDLTVGEITVSLVGVNTQRQQQCLVEDFTLTQLDAAQRFTLPPNSTRTLSQLGVAAADLPTVSMASTPVNQDGCKNAVVNLAFNGRSGEVLAAELPPTEVAPADLPGTGASGPPPWAVALAGLGLVAAGAGSVFLTQRRRALPTTSGPARRTH